MTQLEPKETISLWQLFVLVVAFEIGSAIVVAIGNEAKQDAWIAILLATLIGVAYMMVYNYLLSLRPGCHLYEIIDFGIGRYAGFVLTTIYSIYFFYIASRVLRDFGDLIVTAILINTPMEVINLTLMLAIVYILQGGIEVLCRTTEIFIPYVIGLFFLLAVFLFFSKEIDFKNLLPVLPEGLRPVFKSVFPGLRGFPFGEMITFTVVLKNAARFKVAKGVSIAGIIVAGGLLMFSSIIQIMTLGVDTKTRSNFPLMSAARTISIAYFVERVDAIVVFIMMLGIIVKISVYYYAGLRGLEHVFRIPYRYLNLPLSMIIVLLSLLISDNFAEHIEEGLRFVPQYMHVPLQIIFPTLLLGIVFWKVKVKKGSGGKPSNQTGGGG